MLGDEIDSGFRNRPHVSTAPDHASITGSAAGEVIVLEQVAWDTRIQVGIIRSLPDNQYLSTSR